MSFVRFCTRLNFQVLIIDTGRVRLVRSVEENIFIVFQTFLTGVVLGGDHFLKHSGVVGTAIYTLDHSWILRSSPKLERSMKNTNYTLAPPQTTGACSSEIQKKARSGVISGRAEGTSFWSFHAEQHVRRQRLEPLHNCASHSSPACQQNM